MTQHTAVVRDDNNLWQSWLERAAVSGSHALGLPVHPRTAYCQPDTLLRR